VSWICHWPDLRKPTSEEYRSAWRWQCDRDSASLLAVEKAQAEVEAAGPRSGKEGMRSSGRASKNCRIPNKRGRRETEAQKFKFQLLFAAGLFQVGLTPCGGLCLASRPRFLCSLQLDQLEERPVLSTVDYNDSEHDLATDATLHSVLDA